MEAAISTASLEFSHNVNSVKSFTPSFQSISSQTHGQKSSVKLRAFRESFFFFLKMKRTHVQHLILKNEDEHGVDTPTNS